MGRNMVPGVPDRIHAALRSDAGSVARGPPDLVPTGVREQDFRHGPLKAGPGMSPASIQAGWQWSMESVVCSITLGGGREVERGDDA